MKKLLFALAIFLSGALCWFVVGAANALDLGWVDNSDVRFTQVREFINVAERPISINRGNVDCNFQQLVTRPAKVSQNLISRSEITVKVCAVEANYGLTGNGLLQKSGTGVAGPFTGRSNKEFLANGPRLGSGVLLDSTAVTGVNVAIAPDLAGNIKTTVNVDGTVSHTIKNQAGVINLYNSFGQQMTAMPDTMAFSSNGKWAVFDSSNYGHVRINTDTGASLSFGQKSVYNQGFDPSPKMAVSSDGRYVAVARSGTFLIYDLESCTSQSGAQSYLMNCRSKSLEQARVSATHFGLSVFYMRFLNENVVNYYTDQLVGSVGVTRQYHMTLGDQPLNSFQYLGLGDSFSSGEGAFNYKIATDTDKNKCHVSPNAYAYLVGKNTSKEQYESVACSGAKIEDVFLTEPEDYEGQLPDGVKQTDRVKEPIISGFIPGKITQKTFLDSLKPEAVTISIGGNDLAFADKLKECVTGIGTNQTCFDSYEDRAEVANEIYNLVPNLINTYLNLKADGRKVYVLGYPKIVKPGGDCANNVKLSARELAFADRLTVLINDAVEFAAGQAGVGYVDVENILEGKRLCESNSNDVLVNGITQGDDFGPLKIKVLGQESFHPKSLAHELYAAAILAQTSNLTKPMPVAATTASFPKLSVFDTFLTDAASEGREVYVPKYGDFVASPRINVSSTQNILLDPSLTGFEPQSLVNVELHSTPISLGSFSTDATGNLNISLPIPSNVVPGFHSLHIYGTNQAGEKIDIYDYVLVGKSDIDFDGDGQLDTVEGCVFMEPIGTDTDKDGTDDACDGFADPLPVLPPVIPPVVPDPTPLPQPDPVVEPLPDPVPAPDDTPTPDPGDETQPAPEPDVVVVLPPVTLPTPPKIEDTPETPVGSSEGPSNQTNKVSVVSAALPPSPQPPTQTIAINYPTSVTDTEQAINVPQEERSVVEKPAATTSTLGVSTPAPGVATDKSLARFWYVPVAILTLFITGFWLYRRRSL